MNGAFGAIRAFVAGDSLLGPLGVAAAIAVVVLLERFAPAAGVWLGPAFVAVISAALVAAVFERAG